MESKYLSELSNGETAVIVKVKGHGAFRKRLTEMGFVPGSKITVIKKAPLQDPIEYEIMGYRISLRKSEAEMIETIAGNSFQIKTENQDSIIETEEFQKKIREKTKTIEIAFVGNPNCGKTTLFNLATGKHERVGNYGGVTVDLKTAKIEKNSYSINITDLPGTYSLSAYSPEELFVRKQLTEQMPDIVVNVVDASNLERNLYLTTQLIDMNIKVIIALNMYDELEKKGDNLDYQHLSKMFGIPIVPTVASKGKGLDDLINKVIDVYEERDNIVRHIHVNYGLSINSAISRLKSEIKKNTVLTDKYHSQYVAVKLIENDSEFVKQIKNLPNTDSLLELSEKEVKALELEFSENSETIITDAKYGFIHGALAETYKYAPKVNRKLYNQGLDFILTHKIWGFPIFLLFMWLMFQATFTIGNIPMNWIDNGIGFISELISNTFSDGVLKDLLVNGIIGGVGGVIIFLPNIIILFLFISIMEDTGYMARAAFIMDKLMHKIGLHGKSFIPILMGFGCNVPAIMATRTLENKKDRILTMLIIPFMSCSARLPVFVLFISAFFPSNQGLMLLLMYLALIPPQNHPFLDEHLIYILVLWVLLFFNAHKSIGLGELWANTKIVKKFPVLE